MSVDPGTGLTDSWRRHVSHDTRLLEGVVRRHREKHRRYHTVAHVAAVVEHAERLIEAEAADGAVIDPGAVIAAGVYHDAVYEPTSPSNEQASARLARRDLTTLEWHVERVQHVASMIEATATHRDPPDHDTAILFDADLAVLGADPIVYATYAADVRAEYRHVGDDAWRSGRAAVLTSFLDRPAIYATTTGRRLWESPARRNLATELEALDEVR